MSDRPKAIESFDKESLSIFGGGSFMLEHPIERLKYHIEQTSGSVQEMQCSADGFGFIKWSEGDATYSAVSKWPDEQYRAVWKKE
ncbi:MAG: hypothetical protein OHK006_11090 [Thermodesulfovibrionales bacterium]